MSFLKIMTLALFLTASTAALSACENTWRGAGQDIEETGEQMQDM